MATKDLGKTSTGMQANVAALVTYALWWITGLVFFLIEKDNKFVRFHALQSIIVFGALSVLLTALKIIFQIFLALRLYFVFQFIVLVINLLLLVALILWILLMVKAFQGEKFKLPIAGPIAEKNS